VPVDGLATIQQAMAEFMTGKLYITKLNNRCLKVRKVLYNLEAHCSIY
jgi:hypothetical protein